MCSTGRINYCIIQRVPLVLVIPCIVSVPQVRLTIGLYSVYFRDWLSAFPLNQFHVLRTEDYKIDMVNEINGVLQFLNRSELSFFYEQN